MRLRSCESDVVFIYPASVKTQHVDSYEAVENSDGAKETGGPASWSVGHLQTWLLDQARVLTDGTACDIAQDLFEQGFDRSVTCSLYGLRQVNMTLFTDDNEHILTA
jgi:hypothetical protein